MTENREEVVVSDNIPTPKTDKSSPGGSSSSLRTAETLFRVTPVVLCVATFAVMVRNRQTNAYGTITYTDLTGFNYLVNTSGICAVYSLISAFYTAKLRCRPSLGRAWALYLADMVTVYMLLTASATSTEILVLIYNGNGKVTWSEACSYYHDFCTKAKTSVLISYSTVFCYVGLTLLSSFRLFSRYKHPFPFLRKGGGGGVADAASLCSGNTP